MAKTKAHPRIPSEVEGIQVNHCKNTSCVNFGIPASESRWAMKGDDAKGSYRIIGGERQARYLTCHSCLKHTSLQSNLAVFQELSRFTPHKARIDSASCINQDCSSFGIGIKTNPEMYYQHGKTLSDEPRFRCRACGSTFSAGLPIRKQRRPELNREILNLLVNKVPMRRICEILTINPATLYNKIEYLDHVMSRFSEEQEMKLMQSEVKMQRAYVSVDRQDHTLNWGTQLDRRNIRLGAIGAVENMSGYVLAMQLNFDSGVDPNDVEADAIERTDYELPPVFRHYARVWLRRDYLLPTSNNNDDGEDGEVAADSDIKAPHSGMQVHMQYTQAAIFFHLKRLLQGAEKIRFFLDRDPGLDNACLSAFVEDIKARRVDAFTIQSTKAITMAKKKIIISRSNRAFDDFKLDTGLREESNLKHKYVVASLKAQQANESYSGWFKYPLGDMAEPEKSISYITNFGDFDIDHLVRLYMKASLKGIDRFFMQVRRRLSILERPIGSANNAGRTWFGYSAYSPLVAEQVLRIFRVYYNYCLIGEDKRTPAMRIGLATKPFSLNEVSSPENPRGIKSS
ncbi:MAG: hypothetical protein PHC51_12055 [bacterium]|nr:hypothetical protein [bacterium]